MPRNSVCEPFQVEAERQHAADRRRHGRGPDRRARPSACRDTTPVSSSLTTGLPELTTCLDLIASSPACRGRRPTGSAAALDGRLRCRSGRCSRAAADRAARAEQPIGLARGRAPSPPDGASAPTPSSRGRTGIDRGTRRRWPPATPPARAARSTCSMRVRFADQTAAITKGTRSAPVMPTTWRRMGWPLRMRTRVRAILAQEQRVGDAGFTESLGPQDAAVARAAGPPVRRRVVATVREAVVEPKLAARAG